jgi:hypothetical protein
MIVRDDTPDNPRITSALSPLRDPISQKERHRSFRANGMVNWRTNSGKASIPPPGLMDSLRTEPESNLPHR